MRNYAIQSRYFSSLSGKYKSAAQTAPSLSQMTRILFSYVCIRIYNLAYIQETYVYIIPTIFIKLDLRLLSLYIIWCTNVELSYENVTAPRKYVVLVLLQGGKRAWEKDYISSLQS